MGKQPCDRPSSLQFAQSSIIPKRSSFPPTKTERMIRSLFLPSLLFNLVKTVLERLVPPASAL
jgi:hypothetical protein